MSDLILQYIDTPLPSIDEVWPHSATFSDPIEEINWDSAIRQLAKYEQMECLPLLELAILKSQGSGISFSCVSLGKRSRSENNAESSETRLVKSGAAVIIPLVMQFLATIH